MCIVFDMFWGSGFSFRVHDGAHEYDSSLVRSPEIHLQTPCGVDGSEKVSSFQSCCFEHIASAVNVCSFFCLS